MRLAQFSLLSLLLPLAALAEPHASANHKRHSDISKRASGDVQLHKRFSNARLSFYSAGLGACGKTNGDDDPIVALNADQFGSGFPGPHCFQTITIIYGGKSKQATIMDRCPGCPYGGLDLTPGLFGFFAPNSQGIIYAEWSFGGGGGGGGGAQPNNPPPPPPQPKEQPAPTHTSTTSQKTFAAKTTATSKTKTKTATSSTPAAAMAVPTGSSPSEPNNMNGINQFIVNVGGMINTGSDL